MNVPAPGMTSSAPARLEARSVRVGYGDRVVVHDFDVSIPTGRMTTVIGPNGCGKSTLLRTLSRLLVPTAGAVILDGKNIHTRKSKDVARSMGLLPQTPSAPDGLTVADLVARGRHPHQTWMRQWSSDDAEVVAAALAQTGVGDLAGRTVDSLSGGQRQRVWISMVLAQETPILLLDEPTTYLDLSHAYDVIDLVTELQQEGRTVVMVLHDLNIAVRYSDHLVVMKDGRKVAEGRPADIVTEALLEEVFGLRAKVIDDPVADCPLIVPIGRHHVR